jgi:dTDP-4-dehydrorhamnose reductase
MLGTEVENFLISSRKEYIASDKEVDITDIKQLNRFISVKPVSWIVNCAAYTLVDRAEDEPESAFRINAEGPLNIAHVASKKNAKLIHISTDYVFDGNKNGPYLETDKPNPISIYGKSKLKGEENIIKSLRSYFILRTAWLYGKNGHNFVHTMLKLFETKTEVKVVDDQWGSPTHASDLAAAIVRIIGHNKEACGIYHFTNDGVTNRHRFASEICALALKRGLIEKPVELLPVKTSQYPAKAKRPGNSSLSKEKISKTFDIDLKPWRESLEEFMSYLKN